MHIHADCISVCMITKPCRSIALMFLQQRVLFVRSWPALVARLGKLFVSLVRGESSQYCLHIYRHRVGLLWLGMYDQINGWP